MFPLAIVFAFQDGATRTGLQRAKGARKKRMRTFVIAGTSIELRLSIRLDLDQRSDTMLLNRLPDDFSFRWVQVKKTSAVYQKVQAETG